MKSKISWMGASEAQGGTTFQLTKGDRQADLCAFKATLVYISNSRTARTR